MWLSWKKVLSWKALRVSLNFLIMQEMPICPWLIQSLYKQHLSCRRFPRKDTEQCISGDFFHKTVGRKCVREKNPGKTRPWSHLCRKLRNLANARGNLSEKFQLGRTWKISRATACVFLIFFTTLNFSVLLCHSLSSQKVSFESLKWARQDSTAL